MNRHNLPKERDASVLVLHAHPDDTEAFCGGTLFLLKDAGFSITILTMTAGDAGAYSGTPQETAIIRKQEARRAASLLGARYRCLDEPDGFVFDSKELRIKVINEIRKANAGIVLTHLYNDYHVDHRAVSQTVEAACLLSTLPSIKTEAPPLKETPFLYHTQPIGLKDFMGTDIFKSVPGAFLVDVSGFEEKSDQLLACHESQAKVMQVMHGIEDFCGYMRSSVEKLGKAVGTGSAEALWQHSGGGFPQECALQDLLGRRIKSL